MPRILAAECSDLPSLNLAICWHLSKLLSGSTRFHYLRVTVFCVTGFAISEFQCTVLLVMPIGPAYTKAWLKSGKAKVKHDASLFDLFLENEQGWRLGGGQAKVERGKFQRDWLILSRRIKVSCLRHYPSAHGHVGLGRSLWSLVVRLSKKRFLYDFWLLKTDISNTSWGLASLSPALLFQIYRCCVRL